MRSKSIFFAVLFLVVFSLSGITQQEGRVPSPEEVLGFAVGADFKLADYPMMLRYFQLLDEASDRVIVSRIGTTTEDQPFIIAIISSPENLAQREHYREIARRLASVRGLEEEEAWRLANEGKAVVWIDCGIHATEIAPTQHSFKLAYHLASDNSPQTLEILDKVILVLLPCANPDGLNLVVNWYNRNLGTPYETSRIPWLYHKYVGHDNNRDFFMLTQKETQAITEVLYHQWFPQIVYNHHQTAPFPARIFIPPFAGPTNPNIDPLVISGINLVGSRMAHAFNEAGQAGVISGVHFTTWWNGGGRTTPYYHNIVGILTETALYRYATPKFYTKDDFPEEYRDLSPQANYPNPWKGGWWRIGDAVDYCFTASKAVLDVAAKYKERFLFNIYLIGKRAIEKGQKESPYAFVIPPQQWDPPAAAKMLNILIMGGVEVHVAKAAFKADGIDYPKGSHVILMSQPYRAYAKDLLELQQYPARHLYPGGPPIPPYDITGWTLPYQMGVDTVPIVHPFQGELELISQASAPQGMVKGKASYAYLIPHNTNNSFVAVNRLLKEGHEVFWAAESISVDGEKFSPGAVVIPAKGSIHRLIASISEELSLQIYPLNRRLQGSAYQLKPLRLALYNSWTASMDEGWTRWILEQFEFPYQRLHDAEVRKGKLRDNYDVIILPDIRPRAILEGNSPGTMPPEYCGGISIEGLANLKMFVAEGGTLITLGSSSELPLENFQIPVENPLKDVERTDFFCPGSVLAVEVDTSHPIGYGMREKSAVFFRRSPAFSLTPTTEQTEAKVVVTYPDRNPLMSGWLLGGEHLYNKAAVVDVPVGKGKVILIGFRAQHRAQPHRTFKILFNSIYYGSGTLTRLP